MIQCKEFTSNGLLHLLLLLFEFSLASGLPARPDRPPSRLALADRAGLPACLLQCSVYSLASRLSAGLPLVGWYLVWRDIIIHMREPRGLRAHSVAHILPYTGHTSVLRNDKLMNEGDMAQVSPPTGFERECCIFYRAQPLVWRVFVTLQVVPALPLFPARGNRYLVKTVTHAHLIQVASCLGRRIHAIRCSFPQFIVELHMSACAMRCGGADSRSCSP